MKVNPALIDVVLPFETGYPEHLSREDTRENMRGAAEEAGAVVTDFPQSLWIEPSQWSAVAAENTANKTWAHNYIDRFTNQGSGTRPDGSRGKSSHECTTHSLITNGSAARNRQRRISFGDGPVKDKRLEISAKSASVWLSPLSVYSEANPSEMGGANVQQVLRIMAKRGALPEPVQPRDYKFNHTLIGTTGKGGTNQSAGSWVKLRDFPEGWTETAKHFRPLEFIFPEDIEQAVCLLLHGFAVSVGRNGHAVPWTMFETDQKLFPYPDSYDLVRFDSWNTAKRCAGNGSFSIVSMTTPVDWNFPAGKAA